MDGLCPNLDSPRICANCRGAHSPLHSSWPEFQIQKDIQLFTVNKNVLFKEARELATGKDSGDRTRYDILNFFPLSNQSLPNYQFSTYSSNPSFFPLPFTKTFVLSKPSYVVHVASDNFRPKNTPLAFAKVNTYPSTSAASSTHSFSGLNKSKNSLPSVNFFDHDYFVHSNGRFPSQPSNSCSYLQSPPVLPSFLFFILWSFWKPEGSHLHS